MVNSFKYFVSALFAGLVLTSCSFGKKNNDEVKAQLHLQIGTTHFLNQNYPQALRELLIAEKYNSRDPVIQNNLGLAFEVRDKIDEAERRFKRALELNKNYTDARNNLGRLYVNVGLYKKAIAELEIASNDLTYEQPEKSWANLGQAYFYDKQFDKAKTALFNSLKLRRESCYTMNYYGRSLFELQNYKSAAESLDQAIKYCEKSSFEEPYFFSGMSFYKIGQIEKARARFNEVIAQYPKSVYAKRASEMLEILK